MTTEHDEDVHQDDVPQDGEFSDEVVGVDAAPPTDDATESLRSLVTYIVSNLVDDPDAAEISLDRRGSSVHVQLELPEDDRGKVIGRGGRIAKAIRTVVMVAGSRHHLRVSLNIAD